MKTIIDQRTLRAAVDKAAPFAARNTTLPSLECMTICANGKLEFRAADGANAITVTVPLADPIPYSESHPYREGGVATLKEGEITVNADLFQKTAQMLREGGEITIESNKATRRVQLHIGHQLVAQMTTFEAERPADIILPATAREFYIEADKLRAIAKACTPFVSNDSMRQNMQGIEFAYDGTMLTATATNGHQLASLSVPAVAGEAFAFIVPADLLRKAAAALTGVVTIRFDTDHIMFESEGVRVTGALIAQKFPEWHAVIPKNNQYTMTASRNQLLQSLTRTALFTNSNTHQIALRMHDLRRVPNEYHALTVCAIDYNNGNEATEFVPADVISTADLGSIVIGFNAVLFRHTLEAFENEEVTMQFESPTRAVTIRETTELGMDALYLLMPVRLTDTPPDHLHDTPLAAPAYEPDDEFEKDSDDDDYEAQEEEEMQRSQHEAEEQHVSIEQFKAKPDVDDRSSVDPLADELAMARTDPAVIAEMVEADDQAQKAILEAEAADRWESYRYDPAEEQRQAFIGLDKYMKQILSERRNP